MSDIETSARASEGRDAAARARAWMAADADPETRAELAALLAAGTPAAAAELAERFAAPMEFGTAGLRGLIGAGPARMNQVTVMQAAAAVARQILEDVPDAATRGVVIGRDARRGSDLFARVTAEVITGHGVRVHWIAAPAPTPVAAFLGKHLGAAAVCIVTASHNPPEYNGFKVYGPSASQIVPPQDARIRAHRDQIAAHGLHDVPRVPFTEAVQRGLVKHVTRKDLCAFEQAIDAQCLGPVPPPAQVIAVTTALHGVGHAWVMDALTRRGHRRVYSVLAQAVPDGRFPTVRFPNPEEKGALDLAMALAKHRGADLVLANDPDTDRLCVAVRSPRETRVLSGNEVGLLLADWVLSEGPRRAAAWPKKPLVACSLVSTMMLEPLAQAHGATYGEVLTGFKWIWDLALKEAAKPDGATFVFGFEEALGYCVGPAVRDKDGIGAAEAVMELAAHEKAAGRTLFDRLDGIARRIGCSHTDQLTVVLPGLDGMARMARIMASWRNAPPAAIAGVAVVRSRDLAGPDAEAAGLPRGDVLTWWLADGSRVIARPSGTEPKLKIYIEARAEVEIEIEANPLDAARGRAKTRVAAAKAALAEHVNAVS